MEISIAEEKKNKIVLEVKGEGHALAGVLVKELWNDEHVKTSGYGMDHPLIGIPKFTVETDGADPRKTVLSAVKRLSKQADKFREDIKEIR